MSFPHPERPPRTTLYDSAGNEIPNDVQPPPYAMTPVGHTPPPQITQMPSLNFSREVIETIKATVAVGATDPELEMFLHYCKRSGLDPLAKQVYGIVRGSGAKRTFTIQTGIDGFLLSAERSGEYLGHDPYEWCGKDGIWKQVWLEDVVPAAAKVTVYRKDRRPLTIVATYAEYAQYYYNDGKWNLMPMWEKMPGRMLGKCALALALRELFPRELSGSYTDDEMGQADNPGASIREHGPAALAESNGSRPSNGTPPPRTANKSNGAAQPTKPATQTQTPAQTSTNGTGQKTARQLCDEQRKRCFALYIELGGDTNDDVKMRGDLGRILGKEVVSRADLTAEEWKQCAGHMYAQLHGAPEEPPADGQLPGTDVPGDPFVDSNPVPGHAR